MNIREFFFKLINNEKDGIYDQLNEINKVNNCDNFYNEFLTDALNKLLAHVKNTVPFYKNVNANVLDEFPVVNKILMKNQPEKFQSTNEITIGKIRHTSGSTGIPFQILQDVKKAKRVNAELIYYRRQLGDELGNKFINLISPSKMDNVSKLSMIKQNVIVYDVTKMDDYNMEQLHKLLIKDKKIVHMLGYASALEKIANYFYDKKYFGDYSLKAIVSSSEMLTKSTIEKLTKVFGCPVYDRYSNEDNGFIAQTDGKSHDFIVNRASYFIEILKFDSDEPAEENELGRIVITDLFNYAQPFVRYDTGDLGAYTYKKICDANRFVLTRMEGRISDVVYDMKNRPISTFAIGCTLEMFAKIKQYQLIQNDYGVFELNLIDPSESYTEKEYLDSLQELLGKGIRLNIHYIDMLPVLNSGKFRRVICNYKPNSEN